MTVEMYRKAVPLTQEELDVLATVRTEGTALHGALIDVVGDAALRSEASTLHALVALGLAQLNERALAQATPNSLPRSTTRTVPTAQRCASDAARAPTTDRTMPDTIPVRGRIYMADLGHGQKPWLVVSNNQRNRALGNFLALRITTTPPSRPCPRSSNSPPPTRSLVERSATTSLSFSATKLSAT